MKNIFIITVLIILTFSCVPKNQGNFEIINNSDFDLDSVSIQPDSEERFINVPRGNKSNITTNMDKVQTDGSYRLSFKNSKTNDLMEHNFGYYTNGFQIEENAIITFENDTIIITIKNK